MNEKKVEGNISPTGNLSLTMRVYYSTYHLWAAKHFAHLAKLIEDSHHGVSEFKIEHRAYVTSVIFSSVAFMEAAINELFVDAYEKHLNYINVLPSTTITKLASFWKPEDRTSILEKYQLALNFSSQTQFDKGNRPYQDVALLINLRDVLVHYKPASLGTFDIQHKFETNLKSRFADNKLMNGSGNPYFPDKCLGYGCCAWATKSSEVFVDAFFDKIGVNANYKRVHLDTP